VDPTRVFQRHRRRGGGAYGLLPRFGLAEQVPDKFDGATFKLAAPEPNAKSGGVLRVGIPNRPPHFDIHQSGTFFNLGAQGCMFDNLVRRDPRGSGKTVIPDLAHSWEIAEDGKTYTFFLRKEVLFHDGAELTAEDVKATAIQQMLQQSLNVECNLRTTVESVWFDDIKSGNYDLAIGAIVSTLLDPSDYFNAWYGKDGPQNYSFWDNSEFQALVPRIDREVDAKQRLTLIRQAEAVMEQDPPLVPVAWEKINDVWYNYVKGHNPYEYFGIYDVVRLDTVWLDKA
jgi:ABC-type transport system substrate-binding protein